MIPERHTRLSSQHGVVLFGVLGSLTLATLLGGGEGVEQAFCAQLLVLVATLTWVVGMIRRGLMVLRRTPLDLPLILLFLFFLSSTLLAPYRHNSWLGLYRYLSYLAIFLIAVNLLSRPGTVRVVGLAILFLSLGEAAFALYQRHVLDMARATGTLSYSTYLVDHLALGLSITLGMVLFDSGGWRLRSVLLAGSLPLLYAILLTGARAGIFSLLAVFLTLGWLKGKGVALTFLLLLLLVILIPNPIRERLLAGARLDIYALERVNIWRQALRVGLTRPFSGVGFGNFEFFSRRFNFPVAEAVGRYGRVAKIAHNQYLQLFADAGVLGLIASLGCLFTFLMLIPRLLASTSGMEKGFLAGVGAFLVHSLFDNPLYLPANSILFSLCFGLLISKAPLREIRMGIGKRWVYVVLPMFLGLVCFHYLARPAISQFLYGMGKEHAEEGDYRRAIERCEQASVLSPGCAVYYDALGKLYSARFGESKALSDLWLACRRFQSAVAANPVDARLYVNFADFLVSHSKRIDIGEGEKDEYVIRLLKKAVELNPYNPFFRRKLSSVYEDLGELGEAKEELERIVELEPNFLGAYYQLGVVYTRMGEPEIARDFFQKVLSFKGGELRSRAQSEYEEKLLEFDWSLLEN